MLQSCVVSVFKASTCHLELSGVPFFESADQLLFDSVDLALTFREFSLAVFKLREVIAIDLLKILHFAKHYEFFLINNLLCMLLKHVILAQLLIS